MEQHTASEVTFHHHTDDAEFKRRVRKTTILLSVITIIELAIGLTIYTMHKGEHPNALLVLMFKGAVCILTLAKAYYIVSVFMHLGDEIRNMIMTVVVPLMLFIWFIGAFLWDGNSYRTMRNRYDKYKLEHTLERPIKSGDTTQRGFGG
ncbi:MAG TPA: cytochrome C oxidase subunit IV family protein [Flavisolibacter sp.]|jgi:cytochrome c oxidase subunit IV|nr:cytochrome C oxidase subunit IV family protein [Flavisolibacter sp.]